MARRLKKQYGRTATVIYPPVDIENLNLSNSKDDYFVTVSRLVPFKRIDLIVDAFSRMPDRKLIVIGDGPELRILKKKAGANIEFTGFLPPANTKKTISRARALVFASIEPFGLVMVEAQACGTPVLAFNRGGASEIITDPACGTLYERQTADAIIETVHNFDRFEKQFDPDKMKTNAQRFSAENFHTAFGTFVEREYAAFRTGLTGRTE
jgi:glycosyltransferase involved in cell wall biosynthesis